MTVALVHAKHTLNKGCADTQCVYAFACSAGPLNCALMPWGDK